MFFDFYHFSHKFSHFLTTFSCKFAIKTCFSMKSYLSSRKSFDIFFYKHTFFAPKQKKFSFDEIPLRDKKFQSPKWRICRYPIGNSNDLRRLRQHRVLSTNFTPTPNSIHRNWAFRRNGLAIGRERILTAQSLVQSQFFEHAQNRSGNPVRAYQWISILDWKCQIQICQCLFHLCLKTFFS